MLFCTLIGRSLPWVISIAVLVLGSSTPALAQANITFQCEGEFVFKTIMSVVEGQIVFSKFPTFVGEGATLESDVKADTFADRDPSLDGVFFIVPHDGPKYLVLDSRATSSLQIIEIDTKANSTRTIGSCVKSN